jgi:hypothetical protein
LIDIIICLSALADYQRNGLGRKQATVRPAGKILMIWLMLVIYTLRAA